ncbi:DUF3068 domain-containing protein [Luteipulveratus halotolerans]|uniref:DUF3068 domain-containing protein n=1 Tax=Luteipulveratus halotolerans TaxID=1631356 RepID=UPI0006815E7B|nr:DUF3068 domain-containing protein [Luteipulveratus halotolerans]
MRKASVVIGLGAFFLTMAVLLKFYAYDKLAVVPLDQNTRQTVVDEHATFFDADKVAPGSGRLTTIATVIGDPAASKAASDKTGKNLVVLNMGQVSDNNNEAPPMDASTNRMVVDRSTGRAVNCCGATSNGKPAQFTGQTIKFPFRTEQKTYQYWDGTARTTMATKYVGTEKIKGLTTYKFVGSLPLTKFREQEVPRGLFGLPDTGGVVADRLYQNTRTLWVEPETGVMMKLQEKQHQELHHDEPGAKPVNALTTTSTFTDETISKNVDDYKTKALLLKILRLWAPLALSILGIALLIGGAAVAVGGRRRDRDSDVVGLDDAQPRRGEVSELV